MRNKFADTFYELGKQDERLAIVVADISPAGSIAKFRNEFPNRFINTGVAEQIMIGMCAGMAMRGLRPFAYTIATFTLYRPFEFVRDDLCYQQLPVTIVGIGGGVTYSTLGATHHAMEDISIASSIPGMSIIAPCDPLEAEAATFWCAKVNSQGPVYLRLGKAGEPTITQTALTPFEFGKIRYLKQGSKICYLSYGPMVDTALKISNQLDEKHAINSSVVSCHTLKPLDVYGISKILDNYEHVIVMEDHVPHGGLGSRVKEIAWNQKAKCTIHHFHLQDKFIHCYGGLNDIYQAHGIDKETITNQLIGSFS